MTDTTVTDPQGDPDLGDNGKKAIKAERDRADAAERQLRAIQAQLEQANQRYAALEQTSQQQTATIADRDLSITRLHVGLDKGLPRTFIDRLQGADEAAIAADADALAALIPAPASAGGPPRPDPSQGSRTPAPTTPQASFEAFMGPLLDS